MDCDYEEGMRKMNQKYTINDFHYDICKFHQAADEVMPFLPTMLPVSTEAQYIANDIENISKAIKRYTSNEENNHLLKRVSWMLEEISELLNANAIEDQVDALTDLLVFTLGTFSYLGLEPENFVKIVMQANMGKIGDDGKVLKDEQGKIIKPALWKEIYAPEPLIKAEIEAQCKAMKECPF